MYQRIRKKLVIKLTRILQNSSNNRPALSLVVFWSDAEGGAQWVESRFGWSTFSRIDIGIFLQISKWLELYWNIKSVYESITRVRA